MKLFTPSLPESGGSALPDAIYLGQFETVSNAGQQQVAGSFQMTTDGESNQGAATCNLVLPVTTYTAADEILYSVQAGLQQVPVSTSDGPAIGFQAVVISEDGENWIQLEADTVGDTGDTVVSFDVTGISRTDGAGSDLVWDPDTDNGRITTTAGGKYGVIVTFFFSWA